MRPQPRPLEDAPAGPRDVVVLSASPDASADEVRATKIAATKARSWHDELIYMAMTDRFHNGDASNDAGCDPAHADRFHGGDWQGLIDKLDYLQSLGATTLWISPAPEQIRGFLGAKDGYHGYWTKDFTKPEPAFGDVKKLRELVDKAHEKGMKVFVDLVLNHTGYGAPMATDPQYHDWFHHHGKMRLPLQWDKETGEYAGLPDFAQEKPQVARWLIDMSKTWIDQTDIDGFRLDAVRHVPVDFWKQFSTEIHAHAGNNFLLLGEVNDPAVKLPARYMNEGGLDSVFDFPLNNAIRDSIGADRGMTRWERLQFFFRNLREHPGEAWRIGSGQADGDMRRVAEVLEQDAAYRRSDMLVTMLDNHDMTRFVTSAGPHSKEKLQLGLALLFTMRGIPSVYYGTEVGMEGQWDDCRKDMAFGRDPALQQHFSKLASIRNGSVALRRGAYQTLLADRDVLAYARSHPSQTVVVALNNAGEASSRDIPVPTALADGTTLKDQIDGASYLVKDGRVHVDLQGRQAVILQEQT